MQPRSIILLLALGVAAFVGTVAVIAAVNRNAASAISIESATGSREHRSAAAPTSPVTLPAAGESTQRELAYERQDIEVEMASMSHGSRFINPEDQPRSFMVRDFRGLNRVPFGYEVENLVLTADGFQLPPPAPGQENQLREGSIASPIETLDFPSNAITPYWLEDIPEGTDIRLELQVSPDGIHWGTWQFVLVDEDSRGQISPIYPDGSPNPNYGYTPGPIFFWGMMQFPYMRWKGTLWSETAATPTLSAIRFFQQDTTLGDGHLAQPVDVGAEGAMEGQP